MLGALTHSYKFAPELANTPGKTLTTVHYLSRHPSPYGVHSKNLTNFNDWFSINNW